MKNDEHIPQNPDDQTAAFQATRRRMMALFTRARIDDDMRHELVNAWTNGRTSSSASLFLSEMKDLIWKLENNFDAPATILYLEAERKKLRSIVLRIATDTGIKDPHDFVRFNRFMKEYSVLKKDLHKYTLEELQQLVRQFRALESNYKQSATHPGTKAWYQSSGIPVPVEN